MGFNYDESGCGYSTTIDGVGKIRVDIPARERPDRVVLDIEGIGPVDISLDSLCDLSNMFTHMVREVLPGYKP